MTGGAGFIGSHLCARLVNDGHDVICLDNYFTGSKKNVWHLIGRPNFELVRHNVINPYFAEVDEIYNLACPASPIHYQFDPIKTTKTSVMGALNMLGLAKETKARLLQASTSEVYGDPIVHPQTESYWGHVNPIGIRSCYDEGKRCAESLCMDYHRQHGIEIKIIRIFNTYGPGMLPNDGRVVSNFIVQALQGSIGKDIRDSQTMGYETYYYAVQLPGGNILRVAQDAETVWSVYDGALPAIVLSCVALMLAAAILSTLLTRALVQPVLNMTEDLDHIQDKVPYKELIPFAESIHADRILRENNEKMRQDFTANVSHELKTPLTSISGYAELIETGIAKPEDVPGFAQKIHGEASRMIQLVNDILQLSSLDNASETSSMPEMEVVDLLDVAKECVERQKLNARHAYITLTYLGESTPVRGNRNLLDELCQNLCDNAIRYNRPGGKVQIVTACTRDGHCSLTVTDNGIGIPRESQSSVFERFFRVDKSRSKATGGTGLGLAIVKHIALIHGARIKLESQVDVGTTITVTFPTAS